MKQKNVADLVEAGVLKVARPKASVTGNKKCAFFFSQPTYSL
jgi:hypothetical protein